MRIPMKLLSGTVGGFAGGLGGAGLWLVLGNEERSCNSYCDDLVALLLGSWAVGVSGPDPHDRFLPTLGGSAAASFGSFFLAEAGRGRGATLLWWPGSIIMATIVSEWFRDPPEDRRLSFGLSPTPWRGWQAATVLRF